MYQRELERQLRRVHPYRRQSRRRRRAMARTKQRMHVVLGVLFGLGLVALLGAVHLATQVGPTVTIGQNAAWGHSYTGAQAWESHATSSQSYFPKYKRPYNPSYDPRSKRAHKLRRAMFWH